ncbi:hypothetical protein [Methylorubrum extorquens]|uniref:Uncharacterized protein n=1 Tax=Methylorubrum extorquens DSM 13060 TaxID=882800 RepID=H1KI21_METEX|nr:hypothetical protein [Methylorubrum extorquens]EHP92853.1 hypothetical protein MetexDRAFT_2283 [Methylorubrum extorquens DSM 13060]
MTTFLAGWLFTALLDLVKELARSLAWPIVVTIIAFRYKDEFKQVTPRVKRLGPSGLELDVPNAQEHVTNDVLSSSGNLKSKTYMPKPSPPIAALEERLRIEVEKIEEANRVDVLLRELATTRLVAAFEFILSLIFGSQIEGLKALDERSQVTVEEAKEFFKQYYNTNPDFYTKGFEGWIGFLEVQELVKQENGMVRITDFGREFLVFLTQRRLPYSKPY